MKDLNVLLLYVFPSSFYKLIIFNISFIPILCLHTPFSFLETWKVYDLSTYSGRIGYGFDNEFLWMDKETIPWKKKCIKEQWYIKIRLCYDYTQWVLFLPCVGYMHVYALKMLIIANTYVTHFLRWLASYLGTDFTPFSSEACALI